MSPRNIQQYQEIRKKRKEQILKVALPLFAKKGYHQTSISDIAKGAKISKGLIYNYFENKEDILLQLSMLILDQTAEEIFSILKNKDLPLSPEEKIKKGINLFFQMMLENEDHWKLSMLLALQIADMPKIHDLMNRSFQVFFHEIEEILRAANYPDAKIKAKLFAAQLDGIALHYFALGKDYDLEEVKQGLINTLIK